MAISIEALGIDRLSVHERLELIEKIWESIPEEVKPDEVPAWHLAELARRRAEADASPRAGAPWPEALARCSLGLLAPFSFLGQEVGSSFRLRLRSVRVGFFVLCFGDSMGVLRLLPIALFLGSFLGCQGKTDEAAALPPFEVQVSTVSQLASIEGAERIQRETKAYSTLADVQDYLRSLDWADPAVRYEVEIIRRAASKPEAKMVVKHVGATPAKTEFLCHEDLTRPDDKTRIEVGPGVTSQMVATMAEQFFEPEAETSTAGAQ